MPELSYRDYLSYSKEDQEDRLTLQILEGLPQERRRCFYLRAQGKIKTKVWQLEGGEVVHPKENISKQANMVLSYSKEEVFTNSLENHLFQLLER